jgi:hypothetical protein
MGCPQYCPHEQKGSRPPAKPLRNLAGRAGTPSRTRGCRIFSERLFSITVRTPLLDRAIRPTGSISIGMVTSAPIQEGDLFGDAACIAADAFSIDPTEPLWQPAGHV